jgi:hypothetical protein
VIVTCPECGAAVPEGGTCLDHFHALLLLEWEIPGGPGAVAHFLAVSSYGLQHPDSMNYTAETLAHLRASLADILDGRLSIAALRQRTRKAMDGPKRVTRRAGDPEVSWRRGGWPITAADVIAGGVDGYAGRVTQWARSVREVLDREGASE